MPWNDPQGLETVLRDQADRIAAVIMVPLMANLGCVEARPGFVAQARDLTQRHGVLLIFDEVVTGFRLALGGAQAA